jgi:hypothetical protein
MEEPALNDDSAADPVRQMSFEALTPSAFLKRSAAVFGDRVAVIDGVR